MPTITIKYPNLQTLQQDLLNCLAESHRIVVLTPSQHDVEFIQKKNAGKKSFQVMSLGKLCHNILSLNTIKNELFVLNDQEALEIIATLAADLFQNLKEFKNLSKSKEFMRELYNIFIRLKNNGVNPQQFQEVVTLVQLHQIDVLRLDYIAKLYAHYNAVLQKHQIFDYPEAVLHCLSTLQQDIFLQQEWQNRFTEIFFYGFYNLSFLELKLIQLLWQNVPITIYGGRTLRNHESQGAWQQNLDPNILSTLLNREVQLLSSFTASCHPDILQRAGYLIHYNSTYPVPDSEILHKSSALQYLCFEDLLDEIEFIAQDIQDLISTQNYTFNDIAIFFGNYHTREELKSLFNALGIPVKYYTPTQTYQEYKSLIIHFFDLFKIILLKSSHTTSGQDGVQNENEHSMDISPDARKAILQDLSDQQYTQALLKIAELSFLQTSSPAFLKELNILLTKIQRYQILYKEILHKPFPHTKVLELIEEETFDLLAKEQEGILVSSFLKASASTYKIVYLPGLTENDDPTKYSSVNFISPESNRILSEQLQKTGTSFKSLLITPTESLEENLHLFYTAMTRAEKQLILSTHRYDNKKVVQPSTAFSLLRHWDPENYTICTTSSRLGSSEHSTNAELHHASVKETSCPVIGTGEILLLSPSGIHTYLQCARKYFYNHLLHIKEQKVFEAEYGTLVHRILEVFNKNFYDAYTKSNLTTVVNLFFKSTQNPDPALQLSFKEMDIELLKATPPFKRDLIQHNFLDAVESLEARGFFEQNIKQIETEIFFEFTPEIVKDTLLTGRIDAIVETEQGYTLIDYKTGKDKPSLDYLLSDYGVRFQGTHNQYKGVFSEKKVKEYDYQIPLYYLACKDREPYQQKLKKAGYIYVRPPQIHKGSKTDLIDSQQIEMYAQTILENLNKTVIIPIKQTEQFQQTTDKNLCRSCSYQILCDQEDVWPD